MKRTLEITGIAILTGILLLVMAGCGGKEPVNTSIHIPELDKDKYNDSFYKEGWKHLKAGNPDLAIKNFQESNSVDEKLFVGFGYAYLAKNKIGLARKNFQRALEINPDNLHAQFGMATMYEQTGDKENAFLIYSKLRTLHPEHAWVKIRYEYIKSTQTEFYLKQAEKFKNEYNMEAYINSLKTASEYSPEIVDIQVEIADHFNFQEQYDKAVVQYEKVLEKLPNNEELLLKLAAVYEKMKKFDSAVMIYQKILESKPGDLDITNKINELKIKFYEVNLPVKFKNIFFKEDLNREELAALIGYYFEKYLEPRPPVIITDISGSFAKEHIIRVCTLKIMQLRPDHSFNRFAKINRASFAVVIHALVKYLEQSETGAYDIRFTPLDDVVEPADISPLHKHYKLIKFLVNSQIIELDDNNNFRPTALVTPPKVLKSIKKILNSIKER